MSGSGMSGSGSVGFGGTSSGSGGLGYGLLPPDLEFLVLLDTIATAEAMIDALDLQFETPAELLVFVLMIYDQKYAAAFQAYVSGGTTGFGTGP
jgi:hypothetical protein